LRPIGRLNLTFFIPRQPRASNGLGRNRFRKTKNHGLMARRLSDEEVVQRHDERSKSVVGVRFARDLPIVGVRFGANGRDLLAHIETIAREQWSDVARWSANSSGRHSSAAVEGNDDRK